MLTELLDDFQRACVTASERYGTGVARDAARAAIVAHVAELSTELAEWKSSGPDCVRMLTAHVAELSAERDALKQQAQIHAQEARTANATIAEIYQVCSDGKGEPGNWHGAEPVRKKVAELEARLVDKHKV